MENIYARFQKKSVSSVDQEVHRGHTMNHKMAEAGRDLWRFLGSTLLLKQDHLALVAKNCIHAFF